MMEKMSTKVSIERRDFQCGQKMAILQPVPSPSGESRVEANRRFSSRLPPPLFLGAAFLVLIFSFLCVSARAEADLERLEIVTATGPHVFQIEVARTEEQRSKGLMYRRSLPEDHGMLFDFGFDVGFEDVVTMWMKNTYVSLDMIFVSRGGRVVSIAQDAVPLSEAIISSEKPVFAVIEVNAGTARKIGLSVGDSVRHPMFKP
jgi:hypothetical protein